MKPVTMSTLGVLAVLSCLACCGVPSDDPAQGEPAPAQPAPSAEKSLMSFSFSNPPAEGIIDAESASVAVTVPAGTALESLVADFTSSGGRVTVAGVPQESGITPNDFATPCTYVVHAEDESTASYVVTVVREPSPEKSISSFAIRWPPGAGMIDPEKKIIRVHLPPRTDLSALVAEFLTSGVSVTVNGAAQESGVTVNDFRGPVDYLVTAEDGTIASWSVRVVAALDLLVNEIDIDQPGMDTMEFVELSSGSGVDLCGLSLVLVNGGVTPGREYARVDLGSLGELGAGEFLVVGSPRVTVAAPSRLYTPPSWDLSNRIQNGPADAIMVYDAIGHRVVDTVSYDGVLHRALIAGEDAEVDATEGSSGAPADSGTLPGSVGRLPDGRDTGENGSDFSFLSPPTPGAPNR